MLREYQKKAARFAYDRPASYLALEMGLGKSLISLAVIDYLKMPVLIIAPKMVQTIAFPDEIEKWMPHLRYSVITGTAKQRSAAVDTPADIHLVNYENLKWLIDKHDWRWEFVIFDEISKMKTGGVRTKAFKKVRSKIKKVIGLSGTPAANSLMSLFYQYLALDDGETFGKYITHFRHRFFIDKGYEFPDWRLRPGADKEILSVVRPTMLAMRAEDYISQLPKTILTKHYFELSDEGMSQYRQMRKDNVVDDVIASTAAVKSGKLRQIVSGFLYDEDGEAHFSGDDKMKVVDSILDILGDAQVLIFYGFKAEEELLREKATLISPQAIKDWNAGKLQYMMAHPASAGHGLNLQQSNAYHVLFVSIPWDSELYLQGVGRLSRSGNDATTVFVHCVLASKTIDDKVMKTLNDKLEIHNSVFDFM